MTNSIEKIGTSRSHRRTTFARGGAESIGAIVRAGAEHYQRERHLPCLVPIGSDRLTDPDIETHREIVATLARSLRAERNRGRAGHWTYDLNRHIGLRQAYLAECQLLQERIGRPAGAYRQG
jgi:Family of unknown function (DUF6477)